jgi:hypothetical protein
VSINWPEVVAGVFLGLVPLIVVRTYSYFKYVRSPGKEHYLGEWWNYYRSSTGSDQIRRDKLSIQYSFVRNRLVVHCFSGGSHGPHRGMLNYSGRLTARKNMVRYLYMSDEKSHAEEMMCFIDPFYHPFESTVGVSTTVDLRGLPVAIPVVLARKELSESVLEDLLSPNVIRTDPLKGLPGANDQAT